VRYGLASVSSFLNLHTKSFSWAVACWLLPLYFTLHLGGFVFAVASEVVLYTLSLVFCRGGLRSRPGSGVLGVPRMASLRFAERGQHSHEISNA
jgi:hypothetical protein